MIPPAAPPPAVSLAKKSTYVLTSNHGKYPPTSLSLGTLLRDMDKPTPAADEQQQQQEQQQEEQQEEQQEQQHEETPSDLPPYPPEESQDASDAAAMSAAAVSADAAEGVRMLRNRQDEQARLLASMQSRINELENEVRWLVRADPTRRTATAAAAAASATTTPRDDGEVDREPLGAGTYPAVAAPSGVDDGATNAAASDDEIDAIIESRTKRKLWPLKRRYCPSFTHEADLVRVRFHVSDKYGHAPVRIPKVDKNEGYGLGNREGRLICRLCSGKTMNRNTSWMCATCVVPLCVDVSGGDPNSSCHARWHGCRNLVELNAALNSSLRERRTSRKRSRATDEAAQRCWAAFPANAGAGATIVETPPKVEVVEEEVPRPPEGQVADPEASVSQIL